eukprot:2103403-Amphidinium_carterae.1
MRRVFSDIVALGPQILESRIPFWQFVYSWLAECGATWNQGGQVTVGQVPVLDFSLSLKLWKHGVRVLLRSHAYMQATTRQRGLLREDAFMVDSYLLHHVLITSHACTAQETFCSGGVTTAERMHRHKGVCSDVCEHEGCALRDTVDHRLNCCPSTSQHRRDLVWGDHEDS